jgi:cystathionine beta-lyase family protein involved in aluminum resistance
MDLGGGREIVAQVPKGVAQAGGLVEGRRVFVDVAAYHVFPSPGTPTDAAHYGVEGMSL